MARTTVRTQTGVGEAVKSFSAARTANGKQPVRAGAPVARPAGAEVPRGARKVTPEERYRMIAEAAYFKAQKRGFVGGDPAQDWLEAEAEIDRKLAGN